MNLMTEEPTEVRAREIFGRIAAGEKPALGELYDLVATSLHGYARSLLRVEPDADEALQEVFLGLARNSQNLASVVNPLAYLFRSVRHAALALKATRHRRGEALDAIAEPILEALDPGALLGELDEVDSLLGNLPEEQREVLVLKVYGELTFREIAETLEISQNTAASRYRYAVDKLRALPGDPL